MTLEKMVKETEEFLNKQFSYARKVYPNLFEIDEIEVDAYDIAKALYYENYRKIEDDEIVIKKSEYEALKKDKNDYKQRFESSDKRFEQLVRTSVETLEKQLAKAKQETRKILQELKEKQIFMLENDLFGGNAVLIQGINEIAEKHGIELR